AIIIAVIFMIRMSFAPSETDARAFMQRALTWGGTINATDTSGRITDLEVSRIGVGGVHAAQCSAAPNAGGGRFQGGSRSFICQYELTTLDGEPYRTALRADFQPADGPADTASPGGLVDPGRYRVGNF